MQRRGLLSFRQASAILRGSLVYGAVAFVAYIAVANLRSLPQGALSWRFLATLLGLGMACGLLMLPVAVAWGAFLRTFGVAAPWAEMIAIYGRTNVAKYLPGNVFHFAGRQLLGSHEGWSNSAILLATVLEVVTVAATAAGLTLILLMTAPAPDPLLIKLMLAGLGGGAAVAMALVLLSPLARRFPVVMALRQRLRDVVCSPALPIAVLLYAVFLGSFGAMSVAVLHGLYGTWPWQLLRELTLAYTAAWLVGYVTPGAPGGAGVREAALVMLLGPSLGQAEALSLAVGLRGATILGDLLLFGACEWLRRRVLLRVSQA